jgi:D-glycero-alpha-D-manno-heptose-7-phosphate kinase
MIRTKAPLRLNFAGGCTDIEPYASDYGSYVMSAAIKLYCRAACYEENVSQDAQVDSVEELIENMLSTISGYKVGIFSDVPSMSGLGGSGSCFVAGIKAAFPQLDKMQIAKLAYYLERRVMRITGGSQDQYCAAFGGLLFLIFENNKAEIDKLTIPENLTQHLFLIYAGNRNASGEEIIRDQMSRYNVKAFHQQKQIAKAMRDCLRESDCVGFGKLLEESWRTKCELSPLVSTKELDSLHEKCCSLGVLGGTLMGAGNGGYMLFMEDPNKEGYTRQKLIQSGLQYVNVEFDTEGVQIVEEPK